MAMSPARLQSLAAPQQAHVSSREGQINQQQRATYTQEAITSGLRDLKTWTNSTADLAATEVDRKLSNTIDSRENKDLIEKNKQFKLKDTIYNGRKDSCLAEELSTKHFTGIAAPVHKYAGELCHDALISDGSGTTNTHVVHFEMGAKKNAKSLGVVATYICDGKFDAVCSLSLNPQTFDLSKTEQAKGKLLDNKFQVKLTPTPEISHTPNFSSVTTQIDNDVNHSKTRKHNVRVFSVNVAHDASLEAKLPGIVSTARLIHQSGQIGQECRFLILGDQTEAATTLALADLLNQMENYIHTGTEYQKRADMIAGGVADVLAKIGATPTTLAAAPEICRAVHLGMTIARGGFEVNEILNTNTSAQLANELKQTATNLDEPKSNQIIAHFQQIQIDVEKKLKNSPLQQLDELNSSFCTSAEVFKDEFKPMRSTPEQCKKMERLTKDAIKLRTKMQNDYRQRMELCRNLKFCRTDSSKIVFNKFSATPHNQILTNVNEIVSRAMNTEMTVDRQEKDYIIRCLIALKDYAYKDKGLVDHLAKILTAPDQTTGNDLLNDRYDTFRSTESTRVFQAINQLITKYSSNPVPLDGGTIPVQPSGTGAANSHADTTQTSGTSAANAQEADNIYENTQEEIDEDTTVVRYENQQVAVPNKYVT